jgi:hypothetical protein
MEWIAVVKVVVPLIAKPLIGQVKSRLNQTELEKALVIALETAEHTHEQGNDATKMLFRQCDDTEVLTNSG